MADLLEYLTEQTEEAIRQRMLDRLPSDLDRSEGSFAWDALAPVAIELAQAAIWAQEVLRRGFAQTTFGAYLDLRAEEHGLTRRPAVAATGAVTFTGTAGTVIPVGTRVSTASTTAAPAVVFRTIEAATIPESGSVAVRIEAEVPGASGNVAAGTIRFLAASVPGVTSVTNAEPTTGGADEEDDESLRARLLQRVRSPSASGNRADYVRWALEVPGVGWVSVIPVRDGPGTVSIAIIDMQGQPASPELVQAVQNHIAPDGPLGGGLAPIGADVRVEAATAVLIHVSATLTVAEGYNPDSVRSAVAENIRAYLRSLAFAEDNDVRISRIGQAILDTPGVLDYTDLTVNGGTSNIEVGPQEVAILGVVDLT